MQRVTFPHYTIKSNSFLTKCEAFLSYAESPILGSDTFLLSENGSKRMWRNKQCLYGKY